MPRIKSKKKPTQSELHERDGDEHTSPASSAMEDNDVLIDEGEQANNASLDLILRELREFRKDNDAQLRGIREDINKTNTRVEEAEERIKDAETRIQTNEEAVTEMLKLHIEMDAKLTDLEGRSRRENIRIHGVKEGSEDDAPSMVDFVERLLRHKLELPESAEVRVERAHRALVPKPPPNAAPRSIVAKMASYRTKEEILKLAWQKRGFEYLGNKVNLDHDYAPEVLKQRKEYAEVKSVLKEKKIRFQTPFPAKMRVFYPEGTVLYGSVEEATSDLAKRGFPVTVIKRPETIMEQIRHLTWRTTRKTRGQMSKDRTRDYKEKLQAFRRQEQE
ncbi:putative transposase element L1Md-A101/L1Md-A102/L1Md-A2 [Labeo rohita]|uniref:LINE-1 type transposase domain-containing protein 1 n=3 Tax=Labeo rohita TaxID=84645 RepID=A0ABQ8L2N6_LABRO|nr:LINE-1 type transposase domain-containing protein 1 [Labeo rohita]KAI2645388.1 LINE-1 type transposase domain-containing protein 1 [Labeo rohita]RXN21839.1 putative transposase element L1Md-A101/L1Md-A102/L1Md-A2 [Labeo rohita]